MEKFNEIIEKICFIDKKIEEYKTKIQKEKIIHIKEESLNRPKETSQPLCELNDINELNIQKEQSKEKKKQN